MLADSEIEALGRDLFSIASLPNMLCGYKAFGTFYTVINRCNYNRLPVGRSEGDEQCKSGNYPCQAEPLL
jgi:hypothetical protein